MRTRTQQDWLDALEPLGVPSGPINRMDQVFADPQVVARGMRIDLPHPLAGSVPQVRAPLGFSATPLDYRQPPPLLGEHTAEVLRGAARPRRGRRDGARAAQRDTDSTVIVPFLYRIRWARPR